MRKRFEQQTVLGRKLIEDVEITTARRIGALPALLTALKYIFVTPKYNAMVFEILERKIYPANNNTGRIGMDLWHILVLAQVRLCQNISYDDLHYLANYDKLVREIMGVERETSFAPLVTFGYQSIIDNVGLLDDEAVRELNKVILLVGKEVFKKKEGAALRLKTDSFVVETNVHFPTDYNLLWDSSRKCLDVIMKLHKKQNLKGWRKVNNWYRELKNLMRSLGRVSASGGKGKAERVKSAAEAYLTKATALYAKLQQSTAQISVSGIGEMALLLDLERYMNFLAKHIDLLERRVLKGEEIPHEEKVFSIFEDYTEWITKGKLRPNVELGKRFAITTDQYNLIVDYQIMEYQTDSEILPSLVCDVSSWCEAEIYSWSFDKGFYSKENKGLLAEKVGVAVLPKKGKPNQAEKQEERKPLFRKLRWAHSAVESNINELEHRGLNRCPDKGYDHFKRYVGLAVCAYNLKKIGEVLLNQQRETDAKLKRRPAA